VSHHTSTLLHSEVDAFFQKLEADAVFPEAEVAALVPAGLLEEWKNIAGSQSVSWIWVMMCELSLAGFLTANARFHPMSSMAIYSLSWKFFLHPGSLLCLDLSLFASVSNFLLSVLCFCTGFDENVNLIWFYNISSSAFVVHCWLFYLLLSCPFLTVTYSRKDPVLVRRLLPHVEPSAALPEHPARGRAEGKQGPPPQAARPQGLFLLLSILDSCLSIRNDILSD